MSTATKSGSGAVTGIAVVAVMIGVLFAMWSQLWPEEPQGEDGMHRVTFRAVWIPERDVTVTYSIDGVSTTLRFHPDEPGVEEQELLAPSGAVITLLVENHGVGGMTQCTILIDGVVKDYEHRNDAGDCAVSAVAGE